MKTVEIADFPVQRSATASPKWWENAAVYQAYLRSFSDSDGDGVGDLAGLTARLPYIASLGVDAVWVTPFYLSPMVDGGYDVADYRRVDPSMGGEEAFEALTARAHELGLRVIVEVVPNHVSSQHPWFQRALERIDAPERELFHFREGRGERGELPPNNWVSVFGGSAWTQEPHGQWYLHLFSSAQPDLQWRHPRVQEDFEETLEFWLDRGVDGFRVDVAHGLFKDAEYRDNPSSTGRSVGAILRGPEEARVWDQEEVHAVYRQWRALVSAHGDDKVLLGEVGLRDLERMARYLRSDELHLGFNFHLMHQGFELGGWKDAIESSLAALGRVGATSSWVMSNHDKPRAVRRFGGGGSGRRRARAAHLLTAFLPGAMFLYQGDELGLDDGDARGDDPMNATGGGTSRGGCRVPLPWDTEGDSCGFSSGTPWVAQPVEYRALAVAHQEADASSTLVMMRRALGLRRHFEGAVTLSVVGQCLVARRGDAVCVVNFGETEVSVAVSGEVLVRSCDEGGALMPESALWVRGDVSLG